MAEYIVDIDAVWDLFGSGIVDRSEVHESIVRCRDCKHFLNERGYCFYRNPLIFTVAADSFCAWGERSEG